MEKHPLAPSAQQSRPSARPLRLYLADGARAAEGPEGGALAGEPDMAPHTATWVHDPDDLVPMLSANPIRALAEQGIADVLARTEDDFLVKQGMNKGAMALIDEARAQAIYDAMGPAVEIS